LIKKVWGWDGGCGVGDLWWTRKSTEKCCVLTKRSPNDLQTNLKKLENPSFWPKKARKKSEDTKGIAFASSKGEAIQKTIRRMVHKSNYHTVGAPAPPNKGKAEDRAV